MLHHIIRRIKVTGGFLDGLDLSFAEGLNCVIGGRGTGKTTLLEFIRYALNLGGEVDGEIETRLDKLLKGNLNNGVVEIEFVTSDDVVYVVKRAYKEKPMIFDASGEAVDPRILESGLAINAAIFSQNQIETIAGDTAAQKELVDRFVRRDILRIRQEIVRMQTHLKTNAGNLQLLEQSLQGDDLNLQELPAMKERLDKLNKELATASIEPEVAAASKAKQRRDMEATVLSGLAPVLERARLKVEPLRSGLFPGLLDAIPDSLLDGPNGPLFKKLKKMLADRINEFDSHIIEALTSIERMNEFAEETAVELKKRHAPEDAAYHEILAKRKDNQARVKDRDTLVRQIAELEAKRAARSQVEEQIKAIRTAREKLLWEYSDQCEKRFKLRSGIASILTDLMGRNIAIKVHQQADTAAYNLFLGSLMLGSGKHYKDKLPKVTMSVPPRQLVKLAEKDDVPALAEATGLTTEFAKFLLDAVRKNPEAMRDLEALDTDDAVEVQLLVGSEFKPTDKVSTGQKCSAILPLLLLDSEAPLLIDQPEDNLDNSYVSETVVPKLMDAQKKRQMIFVTHNPNIPVLGDARQVIVMKSDGKLALLDKVGDVDSVKKEIIRLLEGGFDAFEKRRKRYQDAKQTSRN
jgi:ABC-type lipoprotein export system ATPase subunit